jgi:dTMP kinase
MNGHIVVIEGIDGSGKTTQYQMLKERLGQSVATDSFPNYESNSCWFVKQYLAGAFGDNPSDVSAKTASIFYALDRYASFHAKGWGKIYKAGGNVLFSQYWTSNLLHQASKLKREDEKLAFMEWLHNLEINELGLPEADEMISLHLPFEICLRLKKECGHTSCGSMDIHEANDQYLRDSWETANFFAKHLSWHVVKCVNSRGELRPVEEIHEDMYGFYRKVVG